jgi:hypothetical protein
VANQSLICYDVSGAIEENVNNTGWVPFVGGACSNCVVTDGSGNATIAGDFTALELILSGSGPLDVTTPCNTVSAPPGGFGLLGMGTGCVPVIYPTALGSQVPIAYQDGFGNVYQNANTATALAATPAQCSGQYALGITANGTANCSTSTYVLIPEIAAPSGVSGYLDIWADSTVHNPKYNENNAGSDNLLTSSGNRPAVFTWTCPLSSQSANQTYCLWTTPTLGPSGSQVGITVTQLDFGNSGNPTCSTTYPTIEVWDRHSSGSIVGSFAITLGNSVNFYTPVTGSTAVPAGHQLQINEISGSGCSGGSGAVATVTYQMTY